MRPFVIFIIILISSCVNNNSTLQGNLNTGDISTRVSIQPFGDIDMEVLHQLKIKLESWYKIKVHILKKVSLPSNAYYSARGRYNADSLLTFLDNLSQSRKEYLLGVTGKDISIMKKEGINWGIMGYGFQPGNACVVSTYRLKRGKVSLKQLHEKLLKVALHELGHNFGLPHCPVQTCFLVDAEGRDKLESEVEFCKKCQNYLVRKGFQ